MQGGEHQKESSIPKTSSEMMTPARKGDLEPSSEDRLSRIDLEDK